MKATIIVAPHASKDVGSSTRVFDHVDQFATALGLALGSEVTVVEGTLDDAPPEGLLVTFGDLDLTTHPALGPRMVMVNADRSNMRRLSEDLGLAAAIEKHLYFMWRTAPHEDRGYGVYGRKEIAAAIGAEVLTMFPSEHYGMLSSEQHSTLIGLLVAYLDAYVRVRPDALTAS